MPTFRNTILKKEDMSKLVAAYPTEMELLLNSLNGMFSQLHTMLDGGIAFGDNIAAQIKTVTVSEAQSYPISFSYSLRQQPQGIVVLNVQDNTPALSSVQTSKANAPTKQAVAIDWTTAGQNVQIRSLPGLDPKHRYTLTLLVI